KYINLASKSGLVISSKNPDKTMEKVSKDGLNIGDAYTISKDKYQSEIATKTNTIKIWLRLYC
ncbi:hypothetical protein RFZ03_16330, partial [Acinetobacter baumannii]|nr:hypothetical protein [Acinetobacter baumannii]